MDKRKNMELQGYDVFGKAYGVMMRNDLHAPEGVDHKLLQKMILLNENTYHLLYKKPAIMADMKIHELYDFAQQFRGRNDRQTIENVLKYTMQVAKEFQVPFEKMKFGGTEKEILERGTDWCADMARVGVVLLGCCGIPARMAYLVNSKKAYNGHVVTEAFYEDKYGVCDFLYGYYFYDINPVDAYELMVNKKHLEGYSECYRELYSAVAISEYNPLEDYKYTVSLANEYYIRLINENHNDKWIMGEE